MGLRPVRPGAFILLIGFLAIGICFAVSDDSLGGSSSYCQGYARDYADRNSYASTRGGSLGGAARGAAGGAIFGAIAGNAGKGAAIGAGVGAVAGGARRAKSWQYYYDQAFSDCMRRR